MQVLAQVLQGHADYACAREPDLCSYGQHCERGAGHQDAGQVSVLPAPDTQRVVIDVQPACRVLSKDRKAARALTGHPGESVALQAVESPKGPSPNCALVFINASRAIAGKSVRARIRPKMPVFVPAEPRIGRDPQRSVASKTNGYDLLAG